MHRRGYSKTDSLPINDISLYLCGGNRCTAVTFTAGDLEIFMSTDAELKARYVSPTIYLPQPSLTSFPNIAPCGNPFSLQSLLLEYFGSFKTFAIATPSSQQSLFFYDLFFREASIFLSTASIVFHNRYSF